MLILTAVATGFVMDMLWGDPYWIIHPVVIIGKGITALEKSLRRLIRSEFVAGLVMAVIIPFGTLSVTGSVCWLAYRIHPVAGYVVQSIWCWQALSMNGLRTESMKVYDRLKDDDLEGARKAISMIVGRDTAELDEKGITKAAVETVSENFSDGVVAPLIYMIIGGAPAAMVYKAINTMDSMVGYKNDKYILYGRAAAKLDDVANYIPSRLAAIMWCIGSAITGYDGKSAFKIWRRDNRNHASPNSAQTESACAGSLNIQLAGPAYYFGERYEKPYIGDDIKAVSYRNIRDANVIMYTSGIVSAVICLLVRFVVFSFI